MGHYDAAKDVQCVCCQVEQSQGMEQPFTNKEKCLKISCNDIDEISKTGQGDLSHVAVAPATEKDLQSARESVVKKKELETKQNVSNRLKKNLFGKICEQGGVDVKEYQRS